MANPLNKHSQSATKPGTTVKITLPKVSTKDLYVVQEGRNR
jgi:hypothetical protein